MPARRVGGLVRGVLLVDDDRQAERRQREPRRRPRPDRQPSLPLTAGPPRGPALAGRGRARDEPRRHAEARLEPGGPGPRQVDLRSEDQGAPARREGLADAALDPVAAIRTGEERRGPARRGERRRRQRGRRARADARRERPEGGLAPGTRRLRRRPAGELEQRRGQRRHGIEHGRHQPECLVPGARAGLHPDHHCPDADGRGRERARAVPGRPRASSSGGTRYVKVR